MRRTRKWAFVAQEATRLAAVGLSGYAIAKRLEVSEATVSRWVKAGKLTLQAARPDEKLLIEASARVLSPKEWASAVRRDYRLDATDDQLVTMAEATLRRAHDPTVAVMAQLAAMARFQALVRQLALVARAADAAVPAPVKVEPAKASRLRVVRRVSGDPRRALMAVSE